MLPLRRVDIAVVGAGASGSLLCVQLARAVQSGLGLQWSPPPSVALIDADPDAFGRGLAYRDDRLGLMLNASCDKMSVFPDQPDDFARFAGLPDWAFARRELYGKYLATRLRETAARLPIERLVGRAVELSPSGRLRLSSGVRLQAKVVVLALGNLRPRTLADVRRAPRSLPAWPWDLWALDQLAPDATVAAIGTGLSFVDLVVTLLARGHQGPILGLSRHGRVPQVHPPLPDPLPPADEPPLGLHPKLRWLRAQGSAYRAALDSLRPEAERHWAELSSVERARFGRHLGGLWDVHRHRMPPEIAGRFRSALASGQVEVLAGRLRGIGRVRDRLLVRYWPRGARGSLLLSVHRLILATGPSLGEREPFLRSLERRGLLVWDRALGGMALDPSGQLRGRGPAIPIYALGPLRRGSTFETIALREIALQAEALAHRLLT